MSTQFNWNEMVEWLAEMLFWYAVNKGVAVNDKAVLFTPPNQ